MSGIPQQHGPKVGRNLEIYTQKQGQQEQERGYQNKDSAQQHSP